MSGYHFATRFRPRVHSVTRKAGCGRSEDSRVGVSRVRPKFQRRGWLVTMGDILGWIPFVRQDGVWLIYGSRICGDDHDSAMPDALIYRVITVNS